MKFVLFSDLHLDSPFQWAQPSLGRKLRLALRETLDRICRLAVDEGVDALLCAGDLYEQENFTPDTAEYLRSSFEKLAPLRVFIAPGNHDWYGPTALYREVPWSPNVHVFDEARLAAVPLDGQVTLWGAAHRAPANTNGFLQGFHVDGPALILRCFTVRSTALSDSKKKEKYRTRLFARTRFARRVSVTLLWVTTTNQEMAGG